jgi:hypothetical protein
MVVMEEREMGRQRIYPMRKCIAEGCENKHYAKGFCRKHYGTEWRKAKYFKKMESTIAFKIEKI